MSSDPHLTLPGSWHPILGEATSGFSISFYASAFSCCHFTFRFPVFACIDRVSHFVVMSNKHEQDFRASVDLATP